MIIDDTNWKRSEKVEADEFHTISLLFPYYFDDFAEK